MKKALLIGINDYPSHPLRYCVNDAKCLAAVLERNFDGSPNFSVKLDTGVKSKAELKQSIADFFKARDDVGLFYFSGHGFLNEYGGCIVTPDYKNYAEGISMTDILTVVNNSPVSERIVILDCCYSGVFGAPRPDGNAVSSLREGVTILTASRNNETASEVNGHGIFTNLLLSALEGGAADLRGNVSAGSIYAYVDSSLGPFGQRPVFKTNITRFTALRTAKPPIAPETLRKITTYFKKPNTAHPLDPTYEDTQITQIPKHVAIFKDLQKYERVGLVVPAGGEEHMYYAAMNSKSCALTALGQHYWKLVKEIKI